MGWLSVPRDWISSFGEIAKFCGRVMALVYSLRVVKFFGEALRQCGILATLVNGAPLGPFWATFFTNASTTDLWGSVLKTTMFGAIIAIVCCYKGMTASGGAEGVGRAVNQAVVIATTGVFAFNYVFTQTLLATHPEISVIK